eukprot:482002-Lingulodinium_polyedra.AAC.1
MLEAPAARPDSGKSAVCKWRAGCGRASVRGAWAGEEQGMGRQQTVSSFRQDRSDARRRTQAATSAHARARAR